LYLFSLLSSTLCNIDVCGIILFRYYYHTNACLLFFMRFESRLKTRQPVYSENGRLIVVIVTYLEPCICFRGSAVSMKKSTGSRLWKTETFLFSLKQKEKTRPSDVNAHNYTQWRCNCNREREKNSRWADEWRCGTYPSCLESTTSIASTVNHVSIQQFLIITGYSTWTWNESRLPRELVS